MYLFIKMSFGGHFYLIYKLLLNIGFCIFLKNKNV